MLIWYSDTSAGYEQDKVCLLNIYNVYIYIHKIHKYKYILYIYNIYVYIYIYIYTHINNIEEIPAGLLHEGNENVKQLIYTIVCSLVMGQKGPKHIGVGVLIHHIVYISKKHWGKE